MAQENKFGGAEECEQAAIPNLSAMARRAALILPLMLVITDYLAVVAAEHMAVALRDWIMRPAPPMRLTKFVIYLLIPFSYIALAQIYGLYTRRREFWRIVERLFYVNICAVMALVVVMYFLQAAGTTSRLFAVFLPVIAFTTLVVFRMIGRSLFADTEYLAVPALIIGAGKTAELIIDRLRYDTGMGYRFIGCLDDGEPSPKVRKKMPHLGGFSDAERVIKESGVDTVIVAAPGIGLTGIDMLARRLQPLVTHLVFIPDLGTLPLSSLSIETLFDGRLALFRMRNNLAHWHNRAIKRIFDLLLCLLGLIPTVIVCSIIAAIIYLDDKGPILYNHPRLGKGGKIFNCYKFRSMVQNSDIVLREYLAKNPEAAEEWRIYAKLRGEDPRITKAGKWLRHYSLDELPQLINVIKGEMSLVGPRPYLPREKEDMGPDCDTILLTTPGITGYWQVSGRNGTTFDERVSMETWYVRNWSLWFDIVLLWRTIKVVAKKEGAY